ncbi:NUDIX hydrolase [Sporolactobacillus sp. CPB3-1]|uniref:NUDIX hydrolase n=1 Tax=Sporolactobacillus mangiferae TaxID=2940498 RepID=A0ABT0MAJ9_9BACL|nr:NUDIX hydrolase [Sporolactobacillus mangiferae]MCL1631688.1 NUDIX hydrolase [Sporolactobacillus mangiferae]
MEKRHNQFSNNESWLNWAVELQALAQAGLAYSNDRFDQERFTRIREIAAEMMSVKTGLSLDQVKNLFCNETGYQTPKLETRAAILDENRILLVRENAGTWSLPGGWVDVDQSVGSNTIKEVREEAGLDVRPLRLIAVQDRKAHNLPAYAYGVCKIFVLCQRIGGTFMPNIETTESRYFAYSELPPLSEEKNTREQIGLCFQAASDPDWRTLFD